MAFWKICFTEGKIPQNNYRRKTTGPLPDRRAIEAGKVLSGLMTHLVFSQKIFCEVQNKNYFFNKKSKKSNRVREPFFLLKKISKIINDVTSTAPPPDRRAIEAEKVLSGLSYILVFSENACKKSRIKR